MALNNWMGDLPDDRKLNRVVMPASHDSGMAEKLTDLKAWRPASRANACTQVLSIEEQLTAGIRWVDVRLKSYEGEFRCFHSTAYGETMDSVAQGIISFLDANPTEVVVVLLTKSDEDSYHPFLTALQGASRRAPAAIGRAPFAAINPMPHTYQVAQVPLGQLRGRVIVAMDNPPDGFADYPRIVRAKLKKYDAEKPMKLSDVANWDEERSGGKYSFMLNTAGSYSNSSSVDTIKSTQRERANNVKDAVGPCLSVYYTTNTSPVGIRLTSIREADQAMWEQNQLEEWSQVAFQVVRTGNSLPVFNCIMMDYADEGRCFVVRELAEAKGF